MRPIERLLHRPGKSWRVPPFWAQPGQVLSYAGALGDKERIAADFTGLISGAYKANGIVFACLLARMLVLTEARFQWRRLENGRPTDLFGDERLRLLENPWPNGTTGELLARMEQDTALAGNFYATRVGDGARTRIRRLRPDWVTIVTGIEREELTPAERDDPGFKPDPFDLRARPVAYLYEPRAAIGTVTKTDPVTLLASQVAHFSPYPDPEAQWRGMSLLHAVVNEISADSAATKHKLKFFENNAMPGTIVTYGKEVPVETVQAFVKTFREQLKGADNAYSTLHIGGGADVTVAGADLKQLDFKAVQGAGEPLALDTPIPTPIGWTTMGEIAPGDEVIGRDGAPARVAAVSPVRTGRDCFRVTLKDRTSITADAGHVWRAVDRQTAQRKEREYTTRDLYELFRAPYNNGAGGHRLALPLSPVCELPRADLLVDPYVLGAWLGDGQTAGAAICGAVDDLKFIAAEIEARGYMVSWWNTSVDKVAVVGVPGGLLAALDALGVLGDKHIPQVYLRASIEQRLDLLRGLMDTDGSVDSRQARGICEFSSKFESLARQVAELVRSLGYRATLSSKKEARSRTGETWRVMFRVEQDRIPFLLPRKVDACESAGAARVQLRSIVSIEPVESVPVRCIAVDSPDHMFLAGDGFTPTHNTRVAAALRVPPVIAGLSEGLAGSSLNAGNFNAARRLFADGTVRPWWRMAAAALQPLVDPPDAGAHLWYDDRDVPFLREDAKEEASIRKEDALTIESFVRAGFKPESAVQAVLSGDFRKLEHTGLFSVQLQPPNSAANGNGKRALRIERDAAGKIATIDEFVPEQP